MMQIVYNEAESPFKQVPEIKNTLESKEKQPHVKLQNLSNKFQMEVIDNVNKKEFELVQKLHDMQGMGNIGIDALLTP